MGALRSDKGIALRFVPRHAACLETDFVDEKDAGATETLQSPGSVAESFRLVAKTVTFSLNETDPKRYAATVIYRDWILDRVQGVSTLRPNP